MINNKVFRASYSVLTLWDSGQWERAIEVYFKTGDFLTRQMAEGREYHQKWQNYTDRTKCLPLEFGGKCLVDPSTELKFEQHLTDWLDLVVVIDSYAQEVVHEYKTGKTDSNSKAFKYQGGVYALGCIMKDMPVKQVQIHHYNQYTKQSDTSIYWITEKYLKETLNWIETTSSDMFNYLTQNDLFTKFKDQEIAGVEIELAD